MAFKEKAQKNIIVDKAWNNLYRRFDNDGLLQENNGLLPKNDGFLPGNDGFPPGKVLDNRKRRQVAYRRMLNAAAFLAACIILGWYFTRETNFPKNDMLVLHNGADVPTLATMLEDGSVVFLSEETSLKYPEHFDDDKRVVILQGNAFFEIKKQSERPFFIDTDLAKVEVRGTSFSVKSKDNSSFLLSVREGEVWVTPKSSKQVIAVKAGESVRLDNEQIQLIDNIMAFDEYFKHIHFKDEHLGGVADIINMHYGSAKLVIDPKVKERLITFTLSPNIDITDIAELICEVLQLQHSQQENTIYISE